MRKSNAMIYSERKYTDDQIKIIEEMRKSEHRARKQRNNHSARAKLFELERTHWSLRIAQFERELRGGMPEVTELPYGVLNNPAIRGQTG